jgi:hypothetical protein
MSQVFTFPSSGPVLKQRYESSKVRKGFFDDRPFLSDVPKDESMSGSAFQFSVKFAAMSTRAISVPTALAAGSPDQYVAFNVTNIYKDYAVAQIAGEAFDAAIDDAGAMIKLQAEALDGAYDSAYESMSLQLYSNGGGLRGVLANTVFTTAVATLTNVGDAVNFWPGQPIQMGAANDDGTGGTGTINAGNIGYVIGMDWQAGTVTFSQQQFGVATNLVTIWPAVAQNCGLFANGDYGAGFVGLAGYNPVAAPSATLFFGVNRTQNVQGLSGWRIVGNGNAYEDSTMDLLTRMCSIGAKPDRMYINPIDWGQWAKTQNSKVIYDRGQVSSFSTPDLMFEALKMMGPKGPVSIIADVGVKQGSGRVVQLSELALMSRGPICRPSNNWGNIQWLPSYNDDVYQTRLVSRAFLKVLRPAAVGVVTF